MYNRGYWHFFPKHIFRLVIVFITGVLTKKIVYCFDPMPCRDIIVIIMVKNSFKKSGMIFACLLS